MLMLPIVSIHFSLLYHYSRITEEQLLEDRKPLQPRFKSDKRVREEGFLLRK